MKRIGDVMRDLPIPRPANGSAAAVTITRPTEAKCPLCRDAGYLRADVPVGHPMFGRALPCECKEREQRRQRAEDLHQLSNLEVFTAHSFEEFDAAVDGTSPAYEAAVAFAEEPRHGWLYLHGPCGVGKTHLAVAIAKHAVERHQMNVYFAVVPDLLDHLRATFDPGAGSAYDERFNAIRSAQLLVLDDLGTENTTPWAREKLYQLVNHRYVEQLPTVITSNVDHKRIDERILSRIMDRRLTTFVELDADDYRRPIDPRRVIRPRR